ncbi:hypothetical protein [Nocardia sp. NPDC051832]|uniref:hypothetical protein n=1 Tax=Nocardia sp. NPDC051832 TaxID=3155673 RepID=UPI00343A5D26
MGEMNYLEMPNMQSTDPPYPMDYKFGEPTRLMYEGLPGSGEYPGLPQIYRGVYDSFGNPPRMNFPKGLSVPDGPDVSPQVRANFRNYVATSNRLRSALQELSDATGKIPPFVDNMREQAERAQELINTSIQTDINAKAPTPALPGQRQDEHMWGYITEGVTKLRGIADAASSVSKDGAGKIDATTARIKELEAELKAARQQLNDLLYRSSPGGGGLGTGAADLRKDATAALDRALDGLRNVGTQAANSGVGSGLGSGLGAMSSLLPMLMQRAMGQNLSDRDLLRRRKEAEPKAKAVPEPAAPPQPGAGAAKPPVAVPNSPTQPGASAPAGQGAGTPAGTRTPGPDGAVVYTFPDGRTQKVSVVVAQALDKAFANKSGTDAHAAYVETPATWPKVKGKIEDPGERVDPYQSMTGDVAVWENRSALLAVFGTESSGTLEVVVIGELKPFTAKIGDGDGEFGDFAGFFHPKGIEVAAAAKPSNASSAPPEPAAAATPPAIAMPTAT